MKWTVLLGWLLLSALFSGQAPLKDTPEKGEWNFSPEKVWGANAAGNDEFGRIAELLVSQDGHVCVRDFAKNASYLFDWNGRFIRKFALQGEQDGQLPFYLNRFRAGEQIVLGAPDKLHFFSQEGDFKRSVQNNLFVRFPLHFESDNEFVYAPTFPRSPVHQMKLMAFNIGSGEEKTLVDLSETAKVESAPQGPPLMIVGLTPQMNLAADGNRIVFGRSDRYEIYIAERTGKILSSFRLDRKKLTAPLEDKRRLIGETRLPEDQKEKVVAQLPDEMTYFSHLEVIDGLIYVFAVDSLEKMTGHQRIEIFSDTGTYLYSGTIGFGGGLQFGSPHNLVIAGGCAYVVLQDDQGRQTLAKYRIKQPPAATRQVRGPGI